jgi:O-antigen/teichoic acid export membrane protein
MPFTSYQLILQKLKLTSLLAFFTKGHERSINIKKNILGSFLIRVIAILIGFVQLPLTLHYLDPTNYGIWLTLSSLLAWFSFLDIGLGHGLRNKFAEAVAKNDAASAKSYISTTYAIIAIIAAIAYGVFLVINQFLNWSVILNAPPEMQGELSLIAFYFFTGFCLSFFIKLISTILVADQKPALNELLSLIMSLLTLAAVIFLKETTEGSLLKIVIAFSFIPIAVKIIASIYLFSKNYKEYRPSFKFVNFKYARDLTSLGIKFFIIQISGVIMYSTDNMIITQILGPSHVVPYNIAYKYFGIATMIFMIIATPFWSGFTQAYNVNDMGWIRNTVKKLNNLSKFFIAGVVIMVAISTTVYKLWVGDIIEVPLLLSIFMGLYVSMMIWGMPFVFFINGVGKIKLQLYYGIGQALLNIPLSIFLAKNFGLGASGVILATLICNFSAIILWPTQYKKIIMNKAYGIWNK